jgi:putative chitinase
MLDWKPVQKRLSCPVIDGVPGRDTLGRLVAAVAQRAYNPTHARIGDALARYAAQFRLLDGQCERLVTLVAETCHETKRYTAWEESFAYDADRLAEVWPGRYADSKGKPNARARSVAGKPQAIANDTYGGRMGNRPGTTDGWDYRGRGATMLTGRDAYAAMSIVTGLDLVGHPDLAADPYSSMLIALWFYQQRGVFTATSDEDERRAVQGGTLGLSDVVAVKRRVRAALSAA